MKENEELIIRGVDIYKSPIKLKEPFVISLGPLTYAQNLVVVIHTDRGITGFGECSPFMAINGESMDTGFIVGQYLAQAVKGKNALDIEGCTLVMNRVIYANYSIKSAFDIALYDIAAQHANLPLYKFLGGINNKLIHTDYTVSIGDPQKMVKDALRIKDQGFTVIKIKLGDSKKADLERIRLIREAIGMNYPCASTLIKDGAWKRLSKRLKQWSPTTFNFAKNPLHDASLWNCRISAKRARYRSWPTNRVAIITMPKG